MSSLPSSNCAEFALLKLFAALSQKTNLYQDVCVSFSRSLNSRAPHRRNGTQKQLRCNAQRDQNVLCEKLAFMVRFMNLSVEMGGCSFIFAVSIISNTKYSEDIGRENSLMVRSAA